VVLLISITYSEAINEVHFRYGDVRCGIPEFSFPLGCNLFDADIQLVEAWELKYLAEPRIGNRCVFEAETSKSRERLKQRQILVAKWTWCPTNAKRMRAIAKRDVCHFSMYEDNVRIESA